MVDKKSPNEIAEEDYESMVFEEGGSLVVDMSNVMEAKFENIPKGTYNAEIDAVEFGTSENSGAPMWTITCKVTDEAYAGRKLMTYASFSRKALPFTKATLMRIDSEMFTGQFSPEDIAAKGELLGKPIRISVKLEEYNGEKRSRIAGILAPKDAGAGASGGDSFFKR